MLKLSGGGTQSPDLTLDGSGAVTSSADFRASYFRSSSNPTSKYIYPDGESQLTHLSIDGGTGDGSNDATLFVSATDNSDWGIKVDKYRGSATDYGIRIDVANSSATSALQILGNDAQQFRVAGNGGVYGSLYYDNANTSYYVDPASTSILNAVRMGGQVSVNTTSVLSSAGQLGIYASSSPYISFHNGTTSRTAYFQEAGSRFYMGEVSYTETEGSFRAPLFYDVTNTAYYVDPYSTSVLNNINFYGTIQSAGSAGSSGQVLTSNGSSSRPTWQDAGGGAWEVIGNYTGTNVASVDFINGTNGFVWNNTYKRIKMYGNAIMNSGSATQGSVMISPLVSSGSSGNVVLSNLCYYIQQWIEGYPEFNASLTTSNEYRSQTNNSSGGYIGYFFIGTRDGSTNLGNNFFSTTIGGTTYYSGRRNSYASVELDINSKGITGSTSWNMFTHTYADHPGFYFYPRRIHGQTSSFGYAEKGLRFALANTSYRFDYDFTFVGLKP